MLQGVAGTLHSWLVESIDHMQFARETFFPIFYPLS